MPESLLDVWPARVVTPDAAYGSPEAKVRAFLLQRDDQSMRLVVLSAEGQVITATDVTALQRNGPGGDLTLADGSQWLVAQAEGCTSCGGGPSAGMAWQLLTRPDLVG